MLESQRDAVVRMELFQLFLFLPFHVLPQKSEECIARWEVGRVPVKC